ncbi:homocitrate synthase/isopropylmalate synthase family protein [Methylobacterium nodulans]|uniref:homocitrate synthase/isopropylmalate synthase family protein n=1 Tax=Methylobacterium nodulans TaxID=114616 RepID=UPI00016199F1
MRFHAYDDPGHATANTLAALGAGARHASVTVTGLGERAGNAALEEVAVALARFGSSQTGIDPRALRRLVVKVREAAGLPLPRGKAIVGEDVFTHESVIHGAGLLRDRATYEALDPEMLGRIRRIVIGKHSGVAAIKRALAT